MDDAVFLKKFLGGPFCRRRENALLSACVWVPKKMKKNCTIYKTQKINNSIKKIVTPKKAKKSIVYLYIYSIFVQELRP